VERVFDGFTLDRIAVGDVTLRVRHGGSGPPVVLLHGHPRTHATWCEVAPRLAARHTVVCPDLRGYGQSTLPPDQPDHAQSSKRAMAADVAGLMRTLGHDRFAVVGHDRGAMVAFRAAMDHPDAVERLVVMDSVPLLEILDRADWRFARDWWHWWFLGQTEKPAERVICADPDSWYQVNGPEVMGDEAHADLWAALRDPAVVHGMCEDYRAGLTVDREHDEEDRARGRRIACPVLLCVAIRDDIEALFGDPVPLWRPWVSGSVDFERIDCGHHQAEEAPAELASALLAFLA
jgi:haloacetate dehalogenase